MEADDDAPVRIGLVQVSLDQRQWRVSLQRTPAAGEVVNSAKVSPMTFHGLLSCYHSCMHEL